MGNHEINPSIHFSGFKEIGETARYHESLPQDRWWRDIVKRNSENGSEDRPSP